MAGNKRIIRATEYFYVDVIENYKLVEQEVIRENQLLKLFKRPKYDERIAGFTNCRDMAKNINLKEITIDAPDKLGAELKADLAECIRKFVKLCNAYIMFQSKLKAKAERKIKLKLSEYKEIANELKECNAEMSEALKELDIVYTDYTEGENKYNF
ncbi:MAG: hypothetical protein K6F52_07760 [Clostridia bacterium]|nr:hypothetical protein [Clostridia bacterium]